MASLNLSSLSTLWSSIKTFLGLHYQDETVLFTGNTTTSASLSESLNNFERFRIEFITNDDICFCQEFTSNQAVSYIFPLGVFVNPSSTRQYLKYQRFDFNSDKTSITINSYDTLQLTLITTATVSASHSGALFSVSKVVGINRINS